MTLDDSHQTVIHYLPCFFPRHFDMFAITLHEWLAQAVWVFVQLLQCAAFGANESMAEYIVTIATNTHNLFLRIDGDF
jgi:hypothetical protein